ncbi:hypothetical protein [Actinoplanes xinjiangensis]|uniref:hypothetical protein n=1 Tax=Actinoplanes xinjiangensis TaxID=512350 RepID=UPI00344400DA
MLYGVKNGSLEDVTAALAARLDCAFESRESDYLGEYSLAQIGDDEIKIVTQPDPDGEPHEDRFEDYEVLIYSDAGADDFGLRDLPVGPSVVEILE